MAGGEEQDEQRKRDQWKAAAKKAVEVPISVRTSDLPKRAASAVVMLAIAIGAFIAGGIWLKAFIYFVAAATFVELVRMVMRGGFTLLGKVGWLLFGAAYIGLAAYFLTTGDPVLVLLVMATVITVDVSAYFSGRRFGKRKIAPAISPSKTWEGLFGAMIMCGLLVGGLMFMALQVSSGKTPEPQPFEILPILLGAAGGAALAVVAQAGDFLESWLKRRAGLKDSSRLIPGHGGFFDRTDGLIPVAIALGLLFSAGAP